MANELFYALSAEDGRGGVVSFEVLRNKTVIIVNVASLCGFTPQYKELQYLYDKYKAQGLMILAFPCNQFGGQEPGDLALVQRYVKARFGATFPVLCKVQVNGDDVHPVYDYLKHERSGPLGFYGIRWNFEKFIINSLGEVVARYESAITPKQLEPLIASLVGS